MTVGSMRIGLDSSWKRRLGSLLFDRPRLAWTVLPVIAAVERWAEFRNRDEELIPNPCGPGFDCDWKWTSDLNVARHFPRIACRIFEAAFGEWPLPDGSSAGIPGRPHVSFVVGHRGRERVPLLLATLSSLLAQRGCGTEVIVVEQSAEPLLPGVLPSPVRWIHQVPAAREMPYSRSWAFNQGVRAARGELVVLHDNDVVVPESYAAEVLRLASAGYEAMRLQRFVFYLDRPTTDRVVRDGPGGVAASGRVGLECVRQNCEGHTLAVRRDAYLKIGGHDEAFLGWGGEDNEFYDRCRMLRIHPWGYLPFLHLWHAPQTEKVKPSGALGHLERTMAVPREVRASRLSALPFGSPDGPLSGQGA